MNDDPKERQNYPWKRLQKTRDSKASWGPRHYETLLTGFGFVYREGANHRIYYDPDDKGNRVSIPRHGELKAYVAELAVEAIERLLKRKGIEP